MNTHKSPSYHRQLNRTVKHRILTQRRYNSRKVKYFFRFTVRIMRRLRKSDTIEFKAFYKGPKTALLNSDSGLDKLINDLMNRAWRRTSVVELSLDQIRLSDCPLLIRPDDRLTQCDLTCAITASTLEAAGAHRPRDSDLATKYH